MANTNTRYMLDTNIASYIIKGHSETIKNHLRIIPTNSLCISAITKAELLHGVAKKPTAKKLPLIVNEFLLRVEILAWDTKVANTYADLRSRCEREGKNLSTMDMLIAAHAVAENAILVTNDQAFYQLQQYLKLEDWTKD